jgi:hypothetical protein
VHADQATTAGARSECHGLHDQQRTAGKSRQRVHPRSRAAIPAARPEPERAVRGAVAKQQSIRPRDQQRPRVRQRRVYVELGKLSNLNEVVANVNGRSPVSINLWLDKGNNGQFFAWDANDVFTSLDGDAFGTAATGQAITVNDSSTVSDLSGIGGNFTLAQLKAGSATGITGNTKVAIWVGICCGNPPPPGSQSALVQSLTVNGVAVG